MRLRLLTIVLLLCLLVSCSNNESASSPTARLDLSSEAYIYLEEALWIMEKNSINRHDIDWVALRVETFDQAQGAETLTDTYDAIRFALEQLGDGHSFFMTPLEVVEYNDGTFNERENPEPSGELVDGKFGYIFLPGFSGSSESARNFATEIQDIIREIDQQKPCGWIVDLRENRGGNMWPMLAGIGPILGKGHVGAFVTPEGRASKWHYLDGMALINESVAAQINGAAYRLTETNPPVAVLIGAITASSGEAVVVAFQHRPSTRSFGTSTKGVSTSNQVYKMSDGAWIVLTVSTFADRTGQLYGGKIAPDVEVVLNDVFPKEAKEWLSAQPACSTDE